MMIRGLTGACHSLSSHLWVYASLYTILPHSFTGWSVIEQLENDWIDLTSLRQPFTGMSARMGRFARGWMSGDWDLSILLRAVDTMHIRVMGI